MSIIYLYLLTIYLFSPHHQTDPPALPSTVPVPELYSTPGCLWVKLRLWGPQGWDPMWKQEVCLLLGRLVALWYSNVHSKETTDKRRNKHYSIKHDRHVTGSAVWSFVYRQAHLTCKESDRMTSLVLTNPRSSRVAT